MKHLSKIMAALLIVLLATISMATFVSAGTSTALANPVIYGDFNSNVIEGAGSRPLTETGTGTGIFTGVYNFDTYTGGGDGYTMFTCITKDVANAPAEYYTMAGVLGTPSSTSYFKPTATGKFLVTYTAATHVTTIYQIIDLPTPVIYGVFNGWAIEGPNAKPLTETGTGTGIFKAIYHFDAFTGAGDGYDMTTSLSKKDSEWGWGSYEQYKMDGTPAGFAATSYFKPTVSGNYEVTYTAATHVTTLYLIVPFSTPVIYGVFNGWAIEGPNAKPLAETGTGTGIFKAIYYFDAFTGAGDGYDMTTSLSKKDSEWGFGSFMQYKMDGTPAGFAATSYFKPTVSGNYEVTYTAATHVTTLYLIVPFSTPVIYGDFGNNNWALEGPNSYPLLETATGSGIFKAIYTFIKYTGTGAGYYMTTSLSKKDSEWGFGSFMQYKMNGDPATFGNTSFFKPTVTGKYLVTYTAATHVTTIVYQAPQTSDNSVLIYIIGMIFAAAAAVFALRFKKQKA